MRTLERSRLLPPRPLSVAALLLLGWTASLTAEDWPQWLGPRRDGTWRESGILERFPAGGLRPRWRTPVGGGYSGPAVYKGRVYLLDRQLAPDVKSPSDPFNRATLPGRERVLCLKESDGTLLWEHAYDAPYTVSYAAGPRTTPACDGNRIYTLGTEGHLLCLDARTGSRVWSHEFQKEYGIKTPLWGFAGHPLVDGNRVICLAGGDGSVAVAFDKETGKEVWRALSAKEPGYAPPMIHEFGGRRQLILWHPEGVNALDPATGRVLWTYPTAPIRFGMTIPSPRKSGDHLFLTSFYNGSLMLRVGASKADLVWESRKVSEKDTDGLHCVMCTPWMEGGFIYGSCSYGQFRCLREETGERLWETYEPTSGKSERWGHAFVVNHGAESFLFSEKGDLIIASLKPGGYRELSRAHLIDPANHDPGRDVVWSHPAFANRSVYVRNDREILCVSLAAGKGR
ncbi:MAG TPA: pyrrolo-quinoline quinone [Verrucomicrobiales bacterium]|nr:pyrrolo-quinoline quinone [Verrucomicrobiales bacterium]